MEVDVADGLALILRQAVEVEDALVDAPWPSRRSILVGCQELTSGRKGQTLYVLYQPLYAWRKPCTATCVV